MAVKTWGTQKESDPVETKKALPILHYDLDYDSTAPEQTLRGFISSIKGMVTRFEMNRDRITEIENELNDVEHYIEIAKFQSVSKGYKLYRKIAELRRERRACKNENDLLRPVYEHFHATDVLNKLTKVQGEVAKADRSIGDRCYQVRTDALEEYLPPKKEEEEPGGLWKDLKQAMETEVACG